MSHYDARVRYRKDADEVAGDIYELRLLGMSYPAIATAIFHYRNVGLTEEQVRYKCGELGCALNQNKTRERAAA